MSEATAYADHGYTEEAVEKLDTQELLRLYKETGEMCIRDRLCYGSFFAS